MKHVVIDIEMNNIRKNSEARKICNMETIEIGAVMLDDDYQEISCFKTFVKPEHNDGITKNIHLLTGITDGQVVNAPRFSEALRMFTKWCLDSEDDITIYAWSENDYQQVTKEMILKSYEMSQEEERLLTNEWFDFQKEFDSNLGFEKCVSLKMALNMAGIDFEGKQHDALDDARNTAELLQVYRNEALFKETLKKIKEMMEPAPIHNTLGDLFDFSAFACA